MRLPFSCGNEVSVFAALDYKSFMSWMYTEGTFPQNNFYDAFSEKVVPYLNPWPLLQSIVVFDNANIHMSKELENSVHECGTRLIFLPPYSPELNTIEVCFVLLK